MDRVRPSLARRSNGRVISWKTGTGMSRSYGSWLTIILCCVPASAGALRCTLILRLSSLRRKDSLPKYSYAERPTPIPLRAQRFRHRRPAARMYLGCEAMQQNERVRAERPERPRRRHSGSAGLRTPRPYVRVAHGHLDARVTEQFLHRADVGTRLEEMRRKGVPKAVIRAALCDPELGRSLLERPLNHGSAHVMAPARAGCVNKRPRRRKHVPPAPRHVGVRIARRSATPSARTPRRSRSARPRASPLRSVRGDGGAE